MSTPTKRNMNWTTVQLGTQAFTGVTQVSFDYGGSLAKFSGDGDHFNTTVINDFNEPKASLVTADVAAAIACPPGTRGALTATLNDAKNGIIVGGGGRTYSLSTAIVADNQVSGAHRQFALHTISFESESADGTTNPLSTTAL